MSIDVWTAAVIDVVAVIEGGVIRGDAAGREQSQLDVVARRQRNAGDGVGIDQGADLGGIGLQLRSLGGDLHRVGNRAHLHLEIETRPLIEHQGDGRLDSRVKTRCLCFYLIGADGKIGKVKNTTLSGLGGDGRAALGVAGRDGGAVEGRSGRIFDCAGDAGGDLSEPTGVG